MTGTDIIMCVLLAWVAIACICVFVSLWNLAKQDMN